MKNISRFIFWTFTSRITYAIIISVFLLCLKRILVPLVWLTMCFRIRLKVKPIDDSVLTMSATNIAQKIRKRKVTSERIVRAYIKRIQEVNPILNAVVDERYSAAVQDAKIIDKFMSYTKLSEEEIEAQKPLLGLPFTVKESCQVKGLSFAIGCKTRLGFIAKEDGEAVLKLKKAGAIPLLVSSTPEMCFGMECDSYITGTTNNPYDTRRTCGGSSGGEGALLGAGASLMGLGSDIGGSVRIPCMFNGLFGHKPSSGIVPSGGHYPNCYDKNFLRFICCGPMVRYAEDMKLLMKVLAGDKLDFDEMVDITKVTVYFMEDMGQMCYMPCVDDEIKLALRKCVDYLRIRNSIISDAKFPELTDSFEMSAAYYFNIEDKPDLFVNQNNPEERYNFIVEGIKFLFSRSTLCYNSLGYYVLHKSNLFLSKRKDQYIKDLCDEFRDKMARQLGDYGIFLYPTIHCSAFPHKHTIFNVIGITYCMIFNVLGFPSTHIPLGLDKNGLPIGIQVIAGPNRDAVCLAIAQELEKEFGGWIPPA